jgi:hypothetical protein
LSKKSKIIEFVIIICMILSAVLWISSNLIAPHDMSTSGFAILGSFGSIVFLVSAIVYPILARRSKVTP